MSGHCGSRGLTAAVLLIFLFTFGCSRPTPDVPTEDATQSNPTPFQSQRTSAPDADHQLSSPHDTGDTVPPFQNSEILPAGTLLTVSLSVPLVAGSGGKESFEAVLDEPVVVEGNTVIPRDAVVAGRIESAHVSKVKPDRGYVQLSLASVQVNGASVPIQTASLFARQLTSTDVDLGTIRLEKGRRLTFRLKEPVFFRNNHPKAGE